MHTPSLALTAHLPPPSPTQCLPTCASVLRRVLSDPPALPPCPIGAITADRLTGFSLVTCAACENRAPVAVHLLLGFILPTDQGVLPQVRPVAVEFVLSESLPRSEHHRVSRCHQTADASQYLVLAESSAHLELGPALRAVTVDDSNVSLTNVDSVFCLLPNC